MTEVTRAGRVTTVECRRAIRAGVIAWSTVSRTRTRRKEASPEMGRVSFTQELKALAQQVSEGMDAVRA